MRVESSPATQSLGHKSSVVRKIFMLVLGVALLTSFFASIAASAAENVFKITNTSFVEASQNVEEDFEATDEASISDALLFHRVGDYAKFKITFNNSDSINHTIESITDDNENEYISLEYADYAGTVVNAGDSFDFLLTIKYTAAVDDVDNRDQDSSFKLYIKYAESEKPDEIDPSSPDTSDNFKIAVTILVISATGLIVCLITAKRVGRKTVKIITIIAIVASAFVISHNTQAASEGTDVFVFSSEFNLYDKLVITLSNDGDESTITVDYNSTVNSIAKPEAPAGYKFDTWKDENGNPISDNTKLTEDTTLYAGFKVDTYTISYTNLTSDEKQGLPTNYNIETSVTIAPLNTRKDSDGDEIQGFAGWKDEHDVISQTVTIPTGQTGNRSFEATWTDLPLPTYTATCNLNGGQGTESYTYTKKTETFAIQNPTKDYYTFKGWSGTGLDGEENTDVKVKKGTRKDLQFEAHYTPTNYNIAYIGLEDPELEGRPTSYNYESVIHLENPADRFDSDGDKTQSFNGWSSSDITITDNKNVTFQNEHGNKSFEANWTDVAPVEFTVTYNLNGGTDPGNKTKFTKFESINVINPTRDYYDFAGWTVEGIEITDKMNVTIPVGTHNNVTLNATWTPVEYNITYENLTDEELDGFTKKFTVLSDPISLTTPANRGDEDVHFDHWSSNSEGVDLSDPSSVPVANLHKDITITANWEANTHTLNIDLNGGTTAQANPTSFTKNTETFTLFEPTKNGFEFKGWSGTGLSGNSNKNVKVEKGTKQDLDFEAHYTAINYSISYTNVTDSEKAAKNLPESYTIETAKTIAKLDDHFDSDGDKTQGFVGWQAEGQSGTSETVSIPLGTTGNKSYIAIWEDVDLPSYIIAYSGLEGATDPGNKNSYKKTDPNYTLTNPTKTGYNFDGWTCEQLEVSAPTTNFVIPRGTRGALTIEAHFSAIQYNVNFAINAPVATDEGDTTSMESLACTYGTACTLPNNTLNLVGYDFAGWNTKADGTGTPYSNSADVTNIRDTAGEVTLYAQWTPKDNIPYTIQFYFENINDDDFTIDNSKTIDNLSGTANTTASVDPANYTFDHFTYTSDQSVTESNIDRHGSTILKLYYTRNTYNITFDANGGTISGTEIFEDMKYGATISKDDFPTATQSGSDFAGWFTEADGGQKITDDITVEGTDIIYAHWTPSEVTLCRKATELHVETCRNNAGGCKNTGYTVMDYSTDPPTVATVGTKGTSDIVYGNISDGDSVQKGDAFDCDINGDGDYDSSTERFYYIRSTNDKAVLIYSNNFQDGVPGSTEHYNYDPAIAQLPTTQQWTALTDIATTYDNNRIARFLNIEDLSSVCNITSLSHNLAFPETCSFMLENTAYHVPSDSGIARSGIWTEETNGDSSNAFRIHSSTLKFTYMDKTGSVNVARPVIEIPIDQLDTSDVDMVTISFNTQGGNTLQSFDMGKGNPLRFREQDYTPTRAGYTFKGWCLDSECETEPNYSTIINSDTTLYAKWEEMDAVAAIGSTGYPSLAAAIAAVPTTGEATEVVLLKNTSESTITTSTGQNIVLNLQDKTFTASNKNALQLSDGSKLKLVSGTIKSSQNDGAVNVNQGSEFEMTGGTINVSGKQALYVNGGTATIYDGNIISTSTQRAAIHNACVATNTPACTNTTGGVINILGGTIENSKTIAVKNEKGTLNIGTHDGYVDTSTPHIIGKTIGVVAGSSFRFYDGTIEGETWPVGTNDTTADTNYTKIAGIETDSELIKDHDSTPKKIYLAPTTAKVKITFDANGGTAVPDYIILDEGDTIGDKLDSIVTTRGLYDFVGWYTAADESGEPVSTTTPINANVTYYAHWSFTPEHAQFNMTNGAMTTYFGSIASWSSDTSTFQSNMDSNFANYSCQEAPSGYNSLGAPNEHACDKPLGFDTGVASSINVYTSDEATKTKGDPVDYVTISDGQIYNMIPGQTYYWESVEDNNVYGTVAVSAEGNRRVIEANDIRNVRDLGGLEVSYTDNNSQAVTGTIKYGILYRGAKIGNSATNANALNMLGITKEIDLRGSTSGETHLATYLPSAITNYEIDKDNYPSNYAALRSALRLVMEEIVANPTNPDPIYFHCTIGSDRTGTLAYFLEGLLGVSEEDRLRDYELSYFTGLLNRNRLYDHQDGSSITHRFDYMHNLYPDNASIYTYFTEDSDPDQKQANKDLVDAFRSAMIEAN